MFKRTAAALACIALLAPMTACGNGDDDKAAKALSASLSKGKQFEVSKKEADCIGEKMVDKIGVEQLQKYKLLTKDLKVDDNLDSIKMNKDDANSAAESISDCADAEKLMEKVLTGGAGGNEAAKKCITDFLTEDVVQKLLAASFAGDQKAATDLVQKPMMECAQKAAQ